MNIKKYRPVPEARFKRYGGAIISVLIALGLSAALSYFVTIIASPLFLAAILFSAWWGGLRAGIVATILSGILIDFFFVPPLYNFSVSLDEVIRFFIFMAEGSLFSWLITALLSKAEEISESQEQLSALSLHQQILREEERKRISLEIHDELGQALTVLKMEVYLLKKQDKSGSEDRIEVPNEKISGLLEKLDTTIQTVRKIATELRPSVLDDLGLMAAIEWQASEFERRTGISCKIMTNTEDIEIEPNCATAVFRIFQESLTNVIRHAEATSVKVILNKSSQNINLQIIDNGKGIKEDDLKGTKSLGLLGMKERARLINGDIEISGENGDGTTVRLSFPYEEECVALSDISHLESNIALKL